MKPSFSELNKETVHATSQNGATLIEIWVLIRSNMIFLEIHMTWVCQKIFKEKLEFLSFVFHDCMTILLLILNARLYNINQCFNKYQEIK